MVDGSRRREPAGRATGELRKLRPLIVLATFILVTAVLYWARTVLIPIAVATLLAFLLTPRSHSSSAAACAAPSRWPSSS